MKVIESRLWSNIIRLRQDSDTLGVRHGNYDLIIEKAQGQFGEENVDSVVQPLVLMDSNLYYHNTNGLINNFGVSNKLYIVVIHWDSVTIKNEEDQFTTIKDLFCRVEFNENCRLNKIEFARTTFTQKEWDAGYCHSHLYKIDRGDPIRYSSMCFGSGPINHTINALRLNYSEEVLDLFFWELDKVVHVESLAGVPYIRMSEIGKTIGERADLKFEPIATTREVLAFCKSFFRAVKIPLGFEGGKYVMGCTLLEFSILVTNYYNKYVEVYPRLATAFLSDLLDFRKKPYVLKDGAIYNPNRNNRNTSWRNARARTILFKDTTYTLKVIEDEESAVTTVNLLDVSYVKYIQRLYLALVNMKFCKSEYGKKESTKRIKERLYAFYASHGICSTNSVEGARTEDSVLFI